MAQEKSDSLVVSNSEAVSGELPMEDSSPRKEIDMKQSNNFKAASGSSKVHIAFIVLVVLVASLFLALIAIIIAFSVEISNLKSGNDGDNVGSGDQQESIEALANRLDNFNMSMNRISQQSNQAAATQQQQMAQNNNRTPMPVVDAALLQQILDNIDAREQQINSTLQEIFQLLDGNTSPIDILRDDLFDVLQFNASLEMLIQDVFQNTEAVSASNSAAQQANSTLSILFQEVLQDVVDIGNITDQLNITLSAQIRDVLELAEDTVARLQAVGTIPTFP